MIDILEFCKIINLITRKSKILKTRILFPMLPISGRSDFRNLYYTGQVTLTEPKTGSSYTQRLREDFGDRTLRYRLKSIATDVHHSLPTRQGENCH